MDNRCFIELACAYSWAPLFIYETQQVFWLSPSVLPSQLVNLLTCQLVNFRQWRYTNRHLKGDYSCRYSSGFAPDSLTSDGILPSDCLISVAKVQLFHHSSK